ncbi:acyl carrier protein [Lacrimispora saccharolytica]|uniref:acyl carrier protein n=1 Tax=Lacrimispora saccharolytica TaxID=84030 RepID=UPI001B73B6F9|nr:acyl carrier protein [Lacrimispora saccharolytica]MBP9001802.1 acyl carrier protein [Lachnospiraceae bacterium]MBS7329827.1 acyl carrier protein [Lachnospiraceae bacterium]MCF2655953.1 acyl carrier protein [Lacrimispora saccharolytica]MCI7557514.1 acyl carrier protein [Lachnospiraceae bacterium]MDD7548102.1 acyl carrier protein [Lachnospiraceae bacterium]
MLEKIAALLNEKLDIDTADVTLEASFKEDLEIDSLDLFDLVMSIEEEFGLEIPSEELEKLTTVGAMVDYLKAHGVE